MLLHSLKIEIKITANEIIANIEIEYITPEFVNKRF